MLNSLLLQLKYDLRQNTRCNIKIFESIKPDLVITDIVMPDMEGLEFIRILMEKRKSHSVIVMSGNGMGMRFLDTSRLFGVRAALQKPFTVRKLKEIIEDVPSLCK